MSRHDAYNAANADIRIRLPRETLEALWGAAARSADMHTAHTMAREILVNAIPAIARQHGLSVDELVRAGEGHP